MSRDEQLQNTIFEAIKHVKHVENARREVSYNCLTLKRLFVPFYIFAFWLPKLLYCAEICINTKRIGKSNTQ